MSVSKNYTLVLPESIFFSPYDYETAKIWCKNHEKFLISTIFVYVASIFSIQYYMKQRKAFDLRVPLILWNAGLVLFSVIGFMKVTQEFLSVVQKYGIVGRSTFCFLPLF